MKRIGIQGIALLTAALVVAACSGASPSGVVTVRPDGSLIFTAVVNGAGFSGSRSMAGYHAIVFEGGRAADSALFKARVTDLQVLDALEASGLVPGNALENDTWSERNDPESKAPDAIIEGPPLEIRVQLPGEDRMRPLADFLEDPGGRGLDLRFGGHRALISQWRSGCLVCLYSCPGSKVGNARYTVRDFVSGTTRFRPKAGLLPPDGTEVTIEIRPVEAG